MFKPVCSKCGGLIAAEDINVGADMAYCRVCNEVGRLSDLTGGRPLPEANLRHPPAGAWYRQDGAGTVIGAAHRSLVQGFFLLIFALFWNSVVSMLVGLVLVSALDHFHIHVPGWLPLPKVTEGTSGLKGTVFLGLFAIPFVAVGVWVAVQAVSALLGRTEVRIQNGAGVVYSGVGRIGRRRRFDAKSVWQVDIDYGVGSKGGRYYFITIKPQTGKTLKFGTMLNEERREFVAAALRQTLFRQ